MCGPVRRKLLSCLADASFRLCDLPFAVLVFMKCFRVFVEEAGVMAYGVKIQISQPATLFATVF